MGDSREQAFIGSSLFPDAGKAVETGREILGERVRSIPPSGIRRFFDLIRSMEGVISLSVGEPDFATPWSICEAAIYSIEQGQTSYTSNSGLLELRQGIAAHLASRYGVEYDPTCEILVTVGVSEALDLVMRSLLDPGDEVIIPDPGYVSYSPCTVLAGGRVVPIPTSATNGFKPLAKDFRQAVTDRTKAILLGYPNNPTGTVMSRGELSQVRAVAEEHDLIVISDEIYDRLVYETEHVCFASLPGARDRTVLLGGFSKAYAMTGWRIGYAAARREITEAMTKIHQYTALCAPISGQRAAIEALANGEPYVQSMVKDYNRRRRVMIKGLNDMGLECIEPRGAFYAFPSVKATGLTSEEFAERLLLEEKVAVVPGTAFGECGEGYVRCCYAASLEDIHEALRRMSRFVARQG